MFILLFGLSVYSCVLLINVFLESFIANSSCLVLKHCWLFFSLDFDFRSMFINLTMWICTFSFIKRSSTSFSDQFGHPFGYVLPNYLPTLFLHTLFYWNCQNQNKYEWMQVECSELTQEIWKETNDPLYPVAIVKPTTWFERTINLWQLRYCQSDTVLICLSDDSSRCIL